MIFRNEYPRPQFRRRKWKTLNGEWNFSYDDLNVGIKEGYYLGDKEFDLKINVPFTYQYKESGIGDSTIHDIVWYKRTFNVDDMIGDNILLCFNGVDYECDVYINGYHVKYHRGGYSPFEVDITPYINKGSNNIVLRVYDPQKSDNPRGKQTWKGKNFECFYLPNTGIWQSVWLETFKKDYINVYSIFTDIDEKKVYGEIENAYVKANKVEVIVSSSDGKILKSELFEFSPWGKTKYSISLDDVILWDLENPYLYNITYRLYENDKLCDHATSRFGMKSFKIENGVICLNHKPIYQRLVLDQGYWVESGITPPSIEHLKEDILLSKEMGFNGARKHQKIEDPYWNYYAEELGFLTWCEMPSAYEFCTSEVSNFIKEWNDVIKVNRNFTSVVTYVPINESWGVHQIYRDVNQQHLSRTMYYIVKTLTNNAVVSVNDGWENPSESDIVTAHDYCKEGSSIINDYKDKSNFRITSNKRTVMFENAEYQGQPILLSEFGGIMLAKDKQGANWGYGDNAKDHEEIYKRIESLIDGIKSCGYQGYCYTQLTDVQQEVNGLLDHDHKAKFDNKRLKAIFNK